MQRHATMMYCSLLVAFISLTSLSRAQFLPATNLEKEKLSSRPSPAQVTQESADALKEKGYVTIGQIFLREEGKYGYINKKGDFVIKPQFDRASPFVNGEARVLVGSTQAFIDKSGKISTLAQ